MNGRGFVLSFAVLMAAMFILIFARLEADHVFTLQYSQSQSWNGLSPARVGIDAMMDINTLMDHRFRMDQNLTAVMLSYGGTLPSPVGNKTNWQRYQSSLTAWARDANTFLFLDLNTPFTDGNIIGRTDTGFIWKQNLDVNRIVFYTRSSLSQIREIDVNIVSESAYTSKSAWALQGSGNVFVKWRYTDQNSGHTDSNSGWLSFSTTLSRYDWVYNDGARRFSLIVGTTPDGNSFILDNNGPSSLTIRYSTRLTIDANTVPTRAEYDLPLVIYRGDTNYTQTAQWLYP